MCCYPLMRWPRYSPVDGESRLLTALELKHCIIGREKKNKSKKNRKNKKAIEDLFDVVALGRFPLVVVRERVGEPGHLYSCPHDGPSHVCGCLA